MAAVARRQASNRRKAKLPNLRFKHLGVRGDYQNNEEETHSTSISVDVDPKSVHGDLFGGDPTFSDIILKIRRRFRTQGISRKPEGGSRRQEGAARIPRSVAFLNAIPQEHSIAGFKGCLCDAYQGFE